MKELNDYGDLGVLKQCHNLYDTTLMKFKNLPFLIH